MQIRVCGFDDEVVYLAIYERIERETSAFASISKLLYKTFFLCKKMYFEKKKCSGQQGGKLYYMGCLYNKGATLSEEVLQDCLEEKNSKDREALKFFSLFFNFMHF